MSNISKYKYTSTPSVPFILASFPILFVSKLLSKFSYYGIKSNTFDGDYQLFLCDWINVEFFLWTK